MLATLTKNLIAFSYQRRTHCDKGNPEFFRFQHALDGMPPL